MKILVSGGTGYIGSHTCVELLDRGYDVVAIDNFSNSSPEVLNRIKTITGKDVIFYEGDVRDRELLNKIFNEQQIDCVIHFAGLKAVGESCAKPLEYYDNNLYGTLVLLEVMRAHNCKNYFLLVRYSLRRSGNITYNRGLQNRRNNQSVRNVKVFSGNYFNRLVQSR